MNVRLVVEALKIAGPAPTAEKMTKVLNSMNNYSLGGYPISFSETSHAGSHYLDIGVIGGNGHLYY